MPKLPSLLMISLSLAGGALAAAASTWEPAGWILALSLLLLLLISLIFRQQMLSTIAACAVAGALLFSQTVFLQLQQQLSDACDNHWVQGDFVIEDWQRFELNDRLTLTPSSSALLDCFAGAKARLRLSYWHNGKPPNYQLGDAISAKAKLRKPRSHANPGGFDYRAWLWRQNIQATGYIKSISHIQPGFKSNNNLREHLKAKLYDLLDDSQGSAVLKALVFADRQDINDNTWQLARESGLAHLLAISGLHLGLLAAVLLALIVLLSRFFPRRAGWSAWWFYLPVLTVTAGYAYLAAWPLPTQRAWLMLAVIGFALSLRQKMGRFNAWAAALLLVLLWQPLNVLDAGFYLSFMAVGMLLWLAPEQKPQNKAAVVCLAVKMQAALLLVLLPLQLRYFSGFSLLALPLNLLVIPVFSLLFLPSVLLASLALWLGLPLAEWLISALVALINWALLGLESLSEFLDGSIFSWQLWGQIGIANLLVLMAAIGLLFLPKALNLRALGAVVCVVAVVFARQAWPLQLDDGGFRVTTFDVGQGTAVLIQTREHALLYDTGPGWRSGGSAMRSFVKPALDVLGLEHLDKVMISHSDQDHAGGLAVVIEHYPEARLLGTAAQPCNAGLEWHWNGVQFSTLWPPSGPNEGNNQACVLSVRSEAGSALFTGDIERSAELALLQAGIQPHDWLLVPHHGSKSSSSPAFLEALKPRVAVITSGFNNPYGLPAATVLSRYQKLIPKARLYNTAVDGAISSVFSSECSPCSVSISAEKRWWQR